MIGDCLGGRRTDEESFVDNEDQENRQTLSSAICRAAKCRVMLSMKRSYSEIFSHAYYVSSEDLAMYKLRDRLSSVYFQKQELCLE